MKKQQNANIVDKTNQDKLLRTHFVRWTQKNIVSIKSTFKFTVEHVITTYEHNFLSAK